MAIARRATRSGGRHVRVARARSGPTIALVEPALRWLVQFYASSETALRLADRNATNYRAAADPAAAAVWRGAASQRGRNAQGQLGAGDRAVARRSTATGGGGGSVSGNGAAGAVCRTRAFAFRWSWRSGNAVLRIRRSGISCRSVRCRRTIRGGAAGRRKNGSPSRRARRRRRSWAIAGVPRSGRTWTASSMSRFGNRRIVETGGEARRREAEP